MAEANNNEVQSYVENNKQFLSRIISYGNAEARGYALALLAEGGEADDIDDVRELLGDIREKKGD